MSCAEGDTGNVYDGLIPFEVSSRELGEMPHDPGEDRHERRQPASSPSSSAQLPNAGVGLARLEFIITNSIGVHPKACLEYRRRCPPT